MNHAIVIDFETANGSPSSVCSVGIVIVRDGEVVDSFYSLIHPYPDYYAWFCQQVHGLGPVVTSARACPITSSKPSPPPAATPS